MGNFSKQKKKKSYSHTTMWGRKGPSGYAKEKQQENIEEEKKVLVLSLQNKLKHYMGGNNLLTWCV